jgi:cell division protein FtsB
MLPVRLPAFGLAHMVMAVAFLLLGLFVYAGLQTAAQSYRLQESRRVLERDIASLETDRAELQGLVDFLGSDEYIEGFARQHLGLVRAGEIQIRIDAPPPPEHTPAAADRWWERIFGRAP